MSRTALIIGGVGQIGLATTGALIADGWRVIRARKTAGGEPLANAETLVLDRDQPGALRAAIGEGVDALIDTVAYDERHARQLLEVRDDVGAMVVISSASVYRDDEGRTLDEARVGGYPRWPGPIAEDQPTVDPGPATYSTRKVALERTLLDGARAPIAVLRPAAIHGVGSRSPREWFFVKRILDGRRAVPLAWGGRSRFHASATANIAELIRLILATPVTGIFNIADPDPPSVIEIGTAIAAVYGHDWRLVAVEGPGPPGSNPWALPFPMVFDMSRAQALGYRPVTTYAAAAESACRSAERMAAAGVAFPDYLSRMFDYAAEDAWLAAQP